jgi:hypothetical protein
MKSLRLFVFVLLSLAATAAFAANPNGTWKWSTQMPNGHTANATLTLAWDNHQLSGSIENRRGKTEIQNAKLEGDQISFTVVRKLRKQELTLSYSGKLQDDTITGTIETTGRDQKPISLPWNATRVK